MAVLLIVIGYPIIAAIYQSLFTQNQGVDASGFVQQGDKFTGLDNYTAIFSGDAASRFWQAFYNTTFFTVVCVVIEVIIGVAMALIMNKAFKAKGLIRASILVPWAIPTVVSALLWRWIFDANGIANSILGTQILWSTDGWHAKLAVILADTWKTAPFIGLLVLAGLQIIPAEVYEAAKIDGASAVKQFWHITLPLVKPALLVAVLFRILDNLRMFDLPYVLIGPGKPSVETVSILAFLQNNNSRYGEAAAFAFLLFLYIVVVAYVFVKLLGADVIGDARAKTVKPAKRRRAGLIARGDTP
jgi:multiple sugar transport system permease protein